MTEAANKQFVLCYVQEPWAFFTTLPLDQQWGDDWNDAPYDCNAGLPYASRYDGESWEIAKVAYDCDLSTPEVTHPHTYYAVDDINGGAVPWLEPWNGGPGPRIWGGTTLREFVAKVEAAGGTIYVPRAEQSETPEVPKEKPKELPKTSGWDD